MKIGLFIPCFMNELYPDICKSTYKILKQQGLDIDLSIKSNMLWSTNGKLWMLKRC